MSWRTLVARLRGTAGREQLEQEMDEEVRFHLQMATQRNIERGMSPAEAHRQAMLTFGSVEEHKESGRDAQRARWAENVVTDARFALRSLRKTPAFTLAAVMTVALGIGANTAVFSVVNGVLLKPLPIPNAADFHYIGWDWGKSSLMPALSAYQYEYVRDNNRAFESVATYGSSERVIGTDESAPPARGLLVSEQFFDVLGLSPDRGRAFDAAESKEGGPNVVILSDAIWRSRFGSDSRILGKSIVLEGEPHMVIGIMPPSYRFPPDPEHTDYIIPLRLVANPENEGHNSQVIARARHDASMEQRRADVARLTRQFRSEHPKLATSEESFQLMSHAQAFASADLSLMLWVLLGSVFCVLMIGCANTANLLLVRAAGRQREIAVRASLGAGRRRIIQQLLTEGLVLSGLAAAIGVVIGQWGVRALLALSPTTLPRMDEIGLDVRVVTFVLIVTVLTGMVFGLAAAIPVLRLNLQSTLRDSARGSTTGGRYARDVLVLAETALAVVLLAGAGLLITSFAKLQSVDPGFRADGALAIRFERYPKTFDATAKRALERDALAKLTALPGVQSAAAVANFPLERGMNFPVDPAEYEDRGQGATELRMVTSGYLTTLAVPLRAGRDFTSHDDRGSPRVAIVNEALAKRWWPGENPIGKMIHIGHFKGKWLGDELQGDVQVIGLAADVREIGLDRPVKSTVLIPRGQVIDDMLSAPKFVVRTGSAKNADAMVPAIRAALGSIDSRLPPATIEQMQTIVDRSVAQPRFRTLILTVFATCALLLAAIGIYGVIAAIVQQGTREFGVRMALGATRNGIALRVLRRCMSLVVLGALIGTALALGVTRFLSSMLFGITATDARTFGLVITVLCAVGALAGYIPARRAARVDPSLALRAD